jgi:hypothetical protein
MECVFLGFAGDRDSTKITNEETESHVSTRVAKHVLSAAPAPGASHVKTKLLKKNSKS